MDNFKNILIYGLGVIGASIAKTLKKQNSPYKIYGFARKEETVFDAISSKVFDMASTSLTEFTHLSDLIIFAVPPKNVPEILQKIYPSLKNNVLLTDVSSVKGSIYSEIEGILEKNSTNGQKSIFYIGSHPMAGSEKKGFENSTDSMFLDSTTLITPFCNFQNQDYLDLLENFWQSLGSKTKIISVQNHDFFTAYSSHFNHLVAASLVNIMHKKYLENSDIKTAIGSSFRDMTRIADSDSYLWAEIVSNNSKNILLSLVDLKEQISLIERMLENNNYDEIFDFFVKAKKNKSELLK